MPPNQPDPPHLSELTVTCHQCGSTSMERLDRKEYRCTHCGAITVISDDDADRVEELLREALSRSNSQPLRTTPPAAKPAGGKVAAMIVGLLAIGFGLPLLLSLMDNHHSTRTDFSAFREQTVPVEDVTVSQLLWNNKSRRYEGTVYNHSGYAIEVPRYTMTLFTAGHKSGSTWSSTDIGTLLPGEYEPITFDPHSFSSETQPDRYELDKPDRIDRYTQEIARLELSQQQLVHQQGQDSYKFVGIVRNGFTRPVDGARILIVLYGADHQILSTDTGSVESLRPGENGLVDINIYPQPSDAKVAAYEYLIDSAFTDRRR
jgi:hypothetical protein